jgi:hypothetical protein
VSSITVDVNSTFNWGDDYFDDQLSAVMEKLRRKQAEFEKLLNDLDSYVN